MSFKKLKKTILNATANQSKANNKKRMIYALKENLKPNNSDELFRSIMDQYYQ